MDEPVNPSDYALVGATDRGNVRIRLHRYETDGGELRYAIELSAYEAWADRWKLLWFFGGIDDREAVGLFEHLKSAIAGDSWEEGDLIPA